MKYSENTSALCMVVLCLMLPTAACNSDSRSPTPGVTTPSPLSQPPVPLTLSGQVFEITPGGRVPAADFPLLVVVVTTSGCAPPCVSTRNWTRENTRTGPDGRYNFRQLPPGSAAVLASSATHDQVCGAGVELGVETQLDVEITSRANPQPSPTMPPLRVAGQVYEMTPAGRVAVSGASIGMDHHGPDSPFFTVFSDAEGRYTACGIPANWPMAFWTGKPGYVDSYVWHRFIADSAVDIELKRQ
jgi:hypothetical protein